MKRLLTAAIIIIAAVAVTVGAAFRFEKGAEIIGQIFSYVEEQKEEHDREYEAAKSENEEKRREYEAEFEAAKKEYEEFKERFDVEYEKAEKLIEEAWKDIENSQNADDDFDFAEEYSKLQDVLGEIMQNETASEIS